jgi:hypothetical protein
MSSIDLIIQKAAVQKTFQFVLKTNNLATLVKVLESRV